MESRTIFVTGATGYLGSAAVEAFAGAGHRVLALARSDAARSRLASLGHEPVQCDLRDAEAVAAAARRADAVVHFANTNDGGNAEADAAFRAAVLGALRGSGKPFVYTSGVWSLGATGPRVADERASNLHPLPLSAWRSAAEADVVSAAAEGVGGIVLRPGIAYGRAGGIPSIFVKEAREQGRVRVVDGGRNAWPVVHVEDLARLYVLALDAPAGSVLHGVAEPAVRMRDVALAASFAGGAPGALLDWPLSEARRELGGFADALALHQRVSARETRALLGWEPTAPSIVEELLVGSYAKR